MYEIDSTFKMYFKILYVLLGIFLIFDIQDLDPKILSIYYHSTLPINENQHLFLLSKLGTHKILPRYFIVLLHYFLHKLHRKINMQRIFT